MTKYKLLKDLPGVKAGTEFILDNFIELETAAICHAFTKSEIESYPDWFAPVEPERWRPERGQRWWYLLAWGRPEASEWSDSYLDYVNCGNCFPTRALAEKAAEGIKSYLEGFHKENQ